MQMKIEYVNVWRVEQKCLIQKSKTDTLYQDEVWNIDLTNAIAIHNVINAIVYWVETINNIQCLW